MTKTYKVYCDHCEDTTPHELSWCRDSKTGENYTDLVCTYCKCITACFDGKIEIKVVEYDGE